MFSTREQLLELGGKLNKVWPYEHAGEFGMLSIDNIEKGELLAFVPRSMVMTIKEAESGLYWKQMKELYLDMSPDIKIRSDYIMLMLYIMQEKRNPFSQWYDWIPTLTTDWESQMISYSEEEFEWYMGSDLLDDVFTNIGNLQNDFQMLSTYLEGF